MAVYDHAYRGYSGRLTPEWSRFLVPARYALQDLFGSRLFLAFFVFCFLWPLVCSVLIYLRHNAEALAALQLPVNEILKVNAGFFRYFVLVPQSWLAFALALIVGPALISPDLRNNAMPLYLSRPLNRTEYTLGKLTVLVALLSSVTWVPGMLLYVFQAYLEPGWLPDHLGVGVALTLGSAVWILLCSLLALALSAWVKWKPISRLLFLGIYFVLFGFSQSINALYRTQWGNLINLGALRDTIWAPFFGHPVTSGLPILVAWLAVLAVWGLCILMLARKIRAYEVVSG